MHDRLILPVHYRGEEQVNLDGVEDEEAGQRGQGDGDRRCTMAMSRTRGEQAKAAHKGKLRLASTGSFSWPCRVPAGLQLLLTNQADSIGGKSQGTEASRVDELR